VGEGGSGIEDGGEGVGCCGMRRTRGEDMFCHPEAFENMRS
jgi:hypothetical protein